MPTTTKLVAALLMAGLGWIAATLAIAYLPDGSSPGLAQPITAVIGLGVGWFYTGPRVEAGRHTALGIGVIGAAILLFWSVLGFAGYEMLQRALKVQYNGPMRALQDMLSLAVEYLREQVKIDVILALALGGAIVGGISGWVARRFR